jgi:DNA repair ATPase RecN
VLFDHVVVHTSDLGGPPSLHADLPGRKGELLVRRRLVEASLELMRRCHLVEQDSMEDGLVWRASDDAASYLELLETAYSTHLKACAAWLGREVRTRTKAGSKPSCVRSSGTGARLSAPTAAAPPSGADVANSQRFILRRLAFTGPSKPTKDLCFVDEVNVVWGASNAGKSFTVKALDYMCGAGSTLPDVRERQGYESCWLELDLPLSGRTTLARALSGGGFRMFHTTIDEAQGAEPARALAAAHAPRIESLSSFLLAELGVADKRVAKNLNGETNAFTFRHFASYVFTEKTPMMAEWSPIRIASQSGETFDKNVLKFILTGVDDSAIVATKKVGDQRSENAGKIEIVEEMIIATTEDLKRLFPDDEDVDALDLEARNETLSHTIDGLQSTLKEWQSTLDRLRRERRSSLDALEELQGRLAEIAVTLEQFALLADVYDSDVGRLEALEEGATALMAGARRPCPLCGADPEHQHEVHGVDHVERSQRAVRAEIAKIRLERADLTKTTASLEAEHEGLVARVRRLTDEIESFERQIQEVRPLEASNRQAYEEFVRARQRLRDGVTLKKRIESLNIRKTALEAFRPTSTSRDSIAVGISGVIGHEFASTVQAILRAWRFPGDPVASLDDRTHDILIDGQNRRGNGKGVRALMNAAFKIGVLAYCRAKELPHPGIVALDSPLLSYRDPLPRSMASSRPTSRRSPGPG